MEKFLILTAGGIGDQILGFQCAQIIKNYLLNPNITVECCARNDVYEPLEYLFGRKFYIKQNPLKEDLAKLIEENNPIGINIINKYKENYEVYYIVPDHLFRHELSFDFKKFRTNPQIIRGISLLYSYNINKDIYIGLISNTEGYLYYDIPELLRKLSEYLPKRTFHVPILNKWADKNIFMGDFNNLPDNIKIYRNPNLIEQIKLMRGCCYGIYTDNGPSHIAYQFAQSRLLLDPRFGVEPRQSIPWLARWRENITESISIKNKPEHIARLVKTNLEIPQTTLIPRDCVLKNLDSDWSRELLFKY